MPKRTKRWVVGLGLALGLYIGYGSLGPSKPDQKLARHLQAICGVAEKNVSTPYRGVEEMSRYLGDHSPPMLATFGELLVEIERIDDERKHDQRARQAARVIKQPLIRCQATLERFFEAVERDAKARALLEHRAERLGRTLEILFGSADRVLGAGISPHLSRWLRASRVR